MRPLQQVIRTGVELRALEPGLYSVLHAVGVVPEEKLLTLRRLGGLNGHPDLRDPGVEVNSGSLGMGISKGRGIEWAKAYRGTGGRVFVTDYVRSSGRIANNPGSRDRLSGTERIQCFDAASGC